MDNDIISETRSPPSKKESKDDTNVPGNSLDGLNMPNPGIKVKQVSFDLYRYLKQVVEYIENLVKPLFLPFMTKDEREQLHSEISDERFSFLTRNTIVVVAFLAIWYLFFSSFSWFMEPLLKMKERGIYFDDGLNLWVQETFESPIFSIIVANHYTLGIVVVLVVMFMTMLAKQEEAWRYILAFTIWFVLEVILQVIFPVRVPVRDPASSVIHIREIYAPWTESWIGVKYAGIPSGHIAAGVMCWITGRVAKVRWVEIFGFVNLWLISFGVIYTGDHYWEDIAITILLCISVFYLTLAALVAKSKSSTVSAE